MPYIAPEDRQLPYSTYVQSIWDLCESKTWREQFANLLRETLVTVYGDKNETRYFKQNEMDGVLACVSLEWAHRWGRESSQTTPLQLAHLTTYPEGEADRLAQAVAEIVPVDDETRRAGHLNYFITIAMIEAVSRKLIEIQQVPGYIDAVASWIYATTTRPYEEQAIEKNGDVFPVGFASGD